MGGNHAERREVLKKLKLDLVEAQIEVESTLSVLGVLGPPTLLLSSLRAEAVASFSKGTPAILLALYGVITMTVASVAENAFKCVYLARTIYRMEKSQ